MFDENLVELLEQPAAAPLSSLSAREFDQGQNQSCVESAFLAKLLKPSFGFLRLNNVQRTHENAASAEISVATPEVGRGARSWTQILSISLNSGSVMSSSPVSSSTS